MIRSDRYYTSPGSTSYTNGSLSFVTPLKVDRGGLTYDIIYTGSPGNRQVVYDVTLGRFSFNTAFEFDGTNSETIFIIYND